MLALQATELRGEAVRGRPYAVLLVDEILDGSLVGAFGMIPQNVEGHLGERHPRARLVAVGTLRITVATNDCETRRPRNHQDAKFALAGLAALPPEEQEANIARRKRLAIASLQRVPFANERGANQRVAFVGVATRTRAAPLRLTALLRRLAPRTKLPRNEGCQTTVESQAHIVCALHVT
jgi:hypothetical protein